MVISGHFNSLIAQNLFAVGGMAISLIAGVGYGMSVASTRGATTIGGLIVGGGCALIGIAVSVALGDVPVLILAVGTVSSAMAGAIGGLVAATLVRRAPAVN